MEIVPSFDWIRPPRPTISIFEPELGSMIFIRVVKSSTPSPFLPPPFLEIKIERGGRVKVEGSFRALPPSLGRERSETAHVPSLRCPSVSLRE